jgi:AcrR family transcriptional regulator
MPRVLTDTDVADFRGRLCEVAERLFAEKGPDAVTMRQLAAKLGVSAMTPYRYFRDKGEILAAVRAAGFNRFAEALEQARSDNVGARARGIAVRDAYMGFAMANPSTYKLMFDLNQPDEARYPDLEQARQRAGAQLTGYVEELVAEGVLVGDPEQLGAMFWAAAHGAIVLELAGKIAPGAARTLQQAMNSTLARGLRTPPSKS